ncbi:hypothetical protein M569_04802 [Genlisea aurea]|uniref:Uncharacterized protein n=1 Tax=Genlisea aurea TaxID=192259 RepID=S8E2S0_9LAMI|nr:hypothetical protein M569_04802 [Genlisea aurea]
MGKVHGSLSRAGKVRGQTPKVAKEEKKKKPRGRAHKRMQYIRRFVTAVAVVFGKTTGPNSSEKKGPRLKQILQARDSGPAGCPAQQDVRPNRMSGPIGCPAQQDVRPGPTNIGGVATVS